MSGMVALSPDTPALQMMSVDAFGAAVVQLGHRPPRGRLSVARFALMSPPLRSTFTTSWPRERSISAVFAPMPLVAPVMT